ncbi:hypothetical protein VKT23_013640 [Stygiomarasmius scandens]|uniref:Uncharacterized protein n=1 Tax=Marasmiellus scandens TaxID=2682957 RepID=A0ABR1J5M7_9AGAR
MEGALSRLPTGDLKKVLKQLQTAADTKNVVEFNHQLVLFGQQYADYMEDAIRYLDSTAKEQNAEDEADKIGNGSGRDTEGIEGVNIAGSVAVQDSASESSGVSGSVAASAFEGFVSGSVAVQSTGDGVEPEVSGSATVQDSAGVPADAPVEEDTHAGSSTGDGIELEDMEGVEPEVSAGVPPGEEDTRASIPETLQHSPRNRADSQTLGFKLDRTGWPGWMKPAGDYLESELQGTGESSIALLQEWHVFERWHGYADPKNAAFSVVRRPPVIGVWFKAGRRFRNLTPKETADGKVDDLPKSFLTWWSAINPDWRPRDQNHLIVLGNEEKGGDWSVLDKCGPCGMLSVIMVLIWWRQSSANLSGWSAAVEDVTVALRGLNKGNRTRGVRRKHVEETEEDEPRRLHARVE